MQSRSAKKKSPKVKIDTIMVRIEVSAELWGKIKLTAKNDRVFLCNTLDEALAMYLDSRGEV